MPFSTLPYQWPPSELHLAPIQMMSPLNYHTYLESHLLSGRSALSSQPGPYSYDFQQQPFLLPAPAPMLEYNFPMIDEESEIEAIYETYHPPVPYRSQPEYGSSSMPSIQQISSIATSPSNPMPSSSSLNFPELPRTLHEGAKTRPTKHRQDYRHQLQKDVPGRVQLLPSSPSPPPLPLPPTSQSFANLNLDIHPPLPPPSVPPSLYLPHCSYQEHSPQRLLIPPPPKFRNLDYDESDLSLESKPIDCPQGKDAIATKSKRGQRNQILTTAIINYNAESNCNKYSPAPREMADDACQTMLASDLWYYF